MVLLPAEQFPIFIDIENALNILNDINGHILIGVKAMPSDNPVRLLNTYKFIRIYFLCCLVPKEQFRFETFSFPVLYINIPY